jgi:signal peptide peptidase SppA
MKLLDIISGPWAIDPAKLGEIREIYATHLRGEKIDIAGVEKRLGRPLENRPAGYEVVGGVAVLPMVGVSAKRMNLMTQISGGVSTELAARDLRAAASDPGVNSIILHIDSPGGTVDGTQTLAQLVSDVDRQKPVIALASGMMASAAYWYGSAARKVYIEDATTQVGSIGVVASHVDVSGAEAAAGMRTTEIVAGKYKRIASQYGPLTPEGRETIQDQVDYLYSLFVQAVADNRGVPVEQVLSDMADGRVFVGQQAVRAGLVDGVSTLDALIADLSRGNVSAGRALTAVASNQPTLEAKLPITREQIAAEAPELLQALIAEGVQQGATAEIQRIQSVMAQSMPGHEALVNALAFDGKTTGPEAAVAIIAAEKQASKRASADLAADAPQPVPQAATPAFDAPMPEDQLANLPIEKRCEAQWNSDATLHREFSSLGAYVAFVRHSEAGTARILRK